MTTSFKAVLSPLKHLRSALAGILMVSSGLAMSAVITTNEAAMDTVFSQASFGGKTIDIRFTASKTIFDSSLLIIDDANEWSKLQSFAGVSAYPTVNMFFVDQMLWCGTPTTTTIGCSNTPGNMLMLDSGYAANPTYGGALASHELGHSLKLGHLTGNNTNLMNPVLSGNTTLDSTQTASILISPLIQRDRSGQRFITITPILVAASVPEPETWAMMLVGLVGIGGWVRRRQVAHA